MAEHAAPPAPEDKPAAAEATTTPDAEKDKSKKKAKRPPNPYVVRETIESIIVAFILAFLFRAFVAEAFVIPTGSMAPTLMGAHKDTVCEHCGALFQSTASSEYDSENRNSLTDVVAVASTCAMCRATNAFDLAGQSNHATFSGDRILVSKFDYLFRDPKRWDVLVFKYPADARMNYIKRLVGLPGEHLHIEGGDVYTRLDPAQPWQLARKPPDKALAMMQVVSDTRYQPKDLVARGWPSLWQAQPTYPVATAPAAAANVAPAGNSAWKVEQSTEKWSATLTGTDERQWLRHYFKIYDKNLWEEGKDEQTTLNIDPYSSRLITDFLAYNTTRFGPRDEVYDEKGLRSQITSENRAFDQLPSRKISFHGLMGLAQDGMHWVGDLAAEYDIDVQGTSGTISVDLVEFGIHYICDIDVASGKATLQAFDRGTPLNAFADEPNAPLVVPTATTAVRGAGRHRLRMANIDDQIMLWIDGSLVEFDHSTAFDSHKFRAAEARRPYWTAEDPLDAAPLAIGGTAVNLKVERAQVWRDIYYIAVRGSNNYSDFDRSDLLEGIANIKDTALRNELRQDPDGPLNLLAWTYSTPQSWSETQIFSKRGSLEFDLKEGQFFPMGDNSAASSDARVWYGHSYVERRFLIGKALLVFWPHLWNAPVPHPNLPRMGRIR